MPEHEVIARDLASGEPIRLRWEACRITGREAARDAPPDVWLAPPLVDLQINGYAGVDFQRDNLTTEELLHAVSKIQAAGCTRFLLTLISDEWPRMLARLDH